MSPDTTKNFIEKQNVIGKYDFFVAIVNYVTEPKQTDGFFSA